MVDAGRPLASDPRHPFLRSTRNVKQVEKVAGEANAEELRKYYDEYRVQNAEAVLLTSAENDRIKLTIFPVI